ncbi:DUF805 domain-containing protein [Endozoicomonas ascidiicola]|uniref:DUF805 domain-containing protein n=1 Tax=Endozoicomonas ascidiicola TaxID=1698521 RepID=UPI00082BBC7B|nr:DUF805 domain-containing protein [Endozoicomonas ascidiicola]
MEYFISALKQYATFEGRARRKEYWMYFLFYIIFFFVVTIIDSVIGTAILSLIYSLGMVIPSISIAARRLHDTDRSGWWQLILFVPLIGTIVMLVFLVQDSKADNEYGPNPKTVAV